MSVCFVRTGERVYERWSGSSVIGQGISYRWHASDLVPYQWQQLRQKLSYSNLVIRKLCGQLA